jgi:hypothetical protein
MTALALSVLVVLVGGEALRTKAADERTRALPLLRASATVPRSSATVPRPDDPVVVPGAVSTNTRGWSHASQAAARAGASGIRPELVDAYTTAVALAPARCHLSVSLLAAIGQVESGNLANRSVDANHRVVPALLGPVLNGKGVQPIADTDDGRWDQDPVWDRALGPLQLIPASWRVVGLDMDGDGLRDPQNVYDAAGAAMTYLCASGRDLATAKGLNEAVLAYNHSYRYLHLVLGWKTDFDAADITGLASEPTAGTPAASQVAHQPVPAEDTQPTIARSVPAEGPKAPSSPAGTPGTTPAEPATLPTASPTKPSLPVDPPASAPSPAPTAAPTAAPSPTPSPTPSPSPAPTAAPSPTPSPTPTAAPSPTPSPTPKPTPSPTPKPTPSADPTCLPTDVTSTGEPGAGEPPLPTPTVVPSETSGVSPPDVSASCLTPSS